MEKRTSFPNVFWTANSIEVLERFAYYGIYMGFGIYLGELGFSKDDLGVIQTVFLGLSYLIPLFSGTLADKYGFKKNAHHFLLGLYTRHTSTNLYQNL